MTSDAEFRMMFMLNNMDINQEGQVSSEDRLFMGSSPRYQSDQAQVNPFGGVRWEGGRPIYSAVGHQVQSDQDALLFGPNQHQMAQEQHQLQMQQQQMQLQQQQELQLQHQQQQLLMQHQHQMLQQQQMMQQQQHELIQKQQHQQNPQIQERME